MATMEFEHLGVPDWGVDLPPESRPGVPHELTPHPLSGTHWMVPQEQTSSVEVLKRADRPALTPVFGTVAPPHGISGHIRRAAYEIPDHRAMHWLLLMAADRVEAIESRFGFGGRARRRARRGSSEASWEPSLQRAH